MQIRKKITITYVALSVFSTLLLCIVMFFLFRQNNSYYFLKRLQDRARVVASIHYQHDPVKAEYFREFKANGLEEMINEKDYVLRVNGSTSFEYNTDLHLSPDFYKAVMRDGSGWEQDGQQYYYAQIFNEGRNQYMVIVTARDRRGNTSSLYLIRIMVFGGLAFVILAYFLGRILAKRVINPVARITREVNHISASNLHNRLPLTNIEDSDEIADLTRTFNDMLDRLETSFEIQANFINNASHELKTPIATIMAESEIALLKERTPEEYSASLESIGRQAARLSSLTESLLKLTQTGYDGQKQVQDVARIDELLMDVKCDLDRLYPNNRISIILGAMPEDESLLILPCNKPLLELAIGNIIANGVKYSDNSEVFVALTIESKTIKVSITDIGIGIPPEDIPYLYEPFFRGKKASRYTGYGLGLPLAMKIIRMHNGDLQVQSQPDKGTVVTITFNVSNIKNPNAKS
ncbi:HAMP domain-containing histidine kinase [Flavobacterium sp. MFBS3-15]|uniref:sensor histidine kinase n=1 Tax=Flavobacterium sp. MFBS3-15 TaxID=2989816 RepID=UPI0022369CEA|nr:HAMP domain-containing sensor histidine kinase [Flavobacterium sp. MFBS3-15]MCW4469317.1 HAMP domain-containing histidine kinase [Flavobacterium sp. MFBS3-15]